tara:strand:+ start:259 stop:633 length:375 start_codon:yes stop_codon:yes gene_type:complete
MPDNLPSIQRDGGQQTSTSHDYIHTDKHDMELSHYVMAERCMLVEYHTIKNEIETDGTSDTLIYILEGGHRGFHKYMDAHLIEEYNDVEDKFYQLHADGELPYSLYDGDPLVEDEPTEGQVSNG